MIEMITVLVIISLLAGLLFPVFRSALSKGKAARSAALVQKLEGALNRYNSDYRDYPHSTDGGALDDNSNLLDALLSQEGLNAPYVDLTDNETASVRGLACIVDGWRFPLQYCHFTDYEVTWESAQPWRFERKMYAFQLVAAGMEGPQLDSDNSGYIEFDEMNNIDGDTVESFITNW